MKNTWRFSLWYLGLALTLQRIKPNNMTISLKKLLVCGLMLIGVSALAQQPAIIPMPDQMTMGTGEWTIKKGATVSCDNAQLRPAAEYLSNMLSTATGYRWSIVKGRGSVRLSLDPSKGTGAYSLSVTTKGATIVGGDYRGVVNGIATLRQLLPADIEQGQVVKRSWTVPCVTVNDRPRFDWRGMELDCSRHFFTVDEIKHLLDVLALYKIDKLHWHLTDDQGWRIEIKRYPLLTERGAWRTYNNQDSVCIRRASEEDAPDLQIQQSKTRRGAQGQVEYGGYYTQQQVRDVVGYARVRGIEVIPEIDMPGHSLMAISNYDGLSCYKQTGWGKLFTTPMCPGKDSMLEFCKNVWSELFDLFPSKYVHIGGDEVDMKNWKTCPDCQKRMRDHGLKTCQQLQTWFNHYMEAYFNAHGKTMIGWDETIEGGLTPNSVVMWWRSWAPESPKKATAQGNPVICTPNSEFYIDYQETGTSIPAIYDFDPMKGLNAQEQKLILGVQGNLWTEWVPSYDRMWYQAFPRMLAIAELGWSSPDRMNLDSFRTRMVAHLPRLQNLGVAYRIPDLTGFYAVNAFTDKGVVDIQCADPSATIRYTTDGSIPQLSSPQYTGPMTISQTTHYAFRTFGLGGRKGDVVKCSYVREDYAPAVTVDKVQEGLTAEWHDYEGADCAGIDQAKVNGTFVTSGVEIPAEAKGNIGLIITGYIDIPADGIYTFALLSDDGSYLKLDGKMVVDNDGEHSPREIIGQHAMRRGLHPLYARYFDHNGGQLRLRVMDAQGREVQVRYVH